jgi:hypothetical protein
MADAAASTLEAIERYAPDIDVPPPAVLDQARRNLELRVAMLREFGAIGSAELAELVGSQARRPGTTVDNWRRAHRVVAVRYRDKTVVPGFLLLEGGQPDPAARAALAILDEQGFGEWQQALWWTVPSPALDGARPVDVLLAARRREHVGARGEGGDASEQLAGAARRRRDWF